MGNRYYHFLLANTAQTTSEILDHFNIAVTLVDLTHRSNRAIGIFHFANDYYTPYDGFYYERSAGLRGALNYPIDTYRRLEFSASLWHSYKDFYFGEKEEAYLVSNYVSFVHDNSIWTYTGPIDGWSLRCMIGPTFNFKQSQIYNYAVLVDFRYYYRFLRHLTFAQRTMLWFNDGTDIRRFYIGGSWGLRGYRMGEIFGRKYVMLNQELRFPFANSLMLHFGSTGIGLAPLRGALFLDAGNAWDYDFPGIIGSFGVGLRGVLFGGLVLRLDMGRRTDFHHIEKGWFFQFFFGWDY
jgi:outer membrane protein assembly factor BamA